MSPGLASPAGRNRRRALAWAGVALLLSLGLASLHDYRGWDHSYYLAQTSSLVEDGDVDLRDDLLHINREPPTLLRLLVTVHANGALRNTFAIGSSILWLPAYGLAMPARALTGAPEARWNHQQLVALHLLNLAFMVWMLWVGDRWLRRMGVARWLSALAALALVLGTPLLIYGFRVYMTSHLASAVAVMLLLLATVRLGDRQSGGAALLWGIALGLVFICRWQDVVKGAVLLVPVLQIWRRGAAPGHWLRLGAAAGAGATAVASIQLHAWLLERGEIFSLPQGSSYLDLAAPELGRFLFSGLSGLLPWSPLFAIGLLGLLLPWRARLPSSWRWLILALLLFDVYFNAAVSDWWGGVGYGPRRMCSDVPLLAVGLANLASWRRLRVPLAVALAACCLWGAVTANLRVNGLRDLGILVQGRLSSAPGAERESAVQPSRAEARELVASWPFRHGNMSYFDGTQGSGRLLTVAIGALVCLLAGWALGGARAPGRIGAVLLAVLALVLFAHLRLLGAGRGDPEERRLWLALSQAARGRVAAGLPAEALAVVDGREDGLDDARRYLRVTALRHRGRDAEARELAVALAGYPFARRLLQELSLEPGERRLLSRLGLFHRVHRQRPERSFAVARPVDLWCEAVGSRLEIARLPGATDSAHRLFSWGRRGEPAVAGVEIEGGDRVVLRTPLARAEAHFDGGLEGAHIFELDWDPIPGAVVLTVVGPGGAAARLEAAASPARTGLGRLELVTGAPPAAEPPPPWGTRFSNLWMSAKYVCRAPAARREVGRQKP